MSLQKTLENVVYFVGKNYIGTTEKTISCDDYVHVCPNVENEKDSVRSSFE